MRENKNNSILSKVKGMFMQCLSPHKHNPDHKVGTCLKCGNEMDFNVPRLGHNGGYVHKSTGMFICEDKKRFEKDWCMCTKLNGVYRDCYSTCSICGGQDAYGKSEKRPINKTKSVEGI